METFRAQTTLTESVASKATEFSPNCLRYDGESVTKRCHIRPGLSQGSDAPFSASCNIEESAPFSCKKDMMEDVVITTDVKASEHLNRARARDENSYTTTAAQETTKVQDSSEKQRQSSLPCSVAYVWFRNVPAELQASGEQENKLEGESSVKKPFKLPKPLVFTPQCPVVKVSCGLSLAAFVTSDARVFLWEIPLYMHDGKDLGTPRAIKALENRQIVDVTCGSHHLACLNAAGEVFMTGCSHYGQTGTIQHHEAQEEQKIPQAKAPLNVTDEKNEATGCLCQRGKSDAACLNSSKDPMSRSVPWHDVYSLTFSVSVTQVACGDRHSLVLTSDGTVWGMGEGVCGWEASKMSETFERSGGVAAESLERPLEELNDPRRLIYWSPKVVQLTPSASNWYPLIRQVACGSNHSLALTVSGTVIAWGTNDHGELGYENCPVTEKKNVAYYFPKEVTFPVGNPGRLDGGMGVSQLDTVIEMIAASAGSLAISKTGVCWMWGVLGWSTPHRFMEIAGLPESGWAPPSSSTLVLSNSELTRLRSNGLLSITDISGTGKPQTVLLKENALGHFDLVGSCHRLTIAVGVEAVADAGTLRTEALKPSPLQPLPFLRSTASSMAPNETEHAPRTLFSQSTTCNSLATTDGAFDSGEDIFRSLTKRSITCEAGGMSNVERQRPGGVPCQPSSQLVQSFNPKTTTPCTLCEQSNKEISILKDKAVALEKELAKFLFQYEDDLSALSGSLKDEKALRLQLQNVLDTFLAFARDPASEQKNKLKFLLGDNASSLKKNEILCQNLMNGMEMISSLYSDLSLLKRSVEGSETVAKHAEDMRMLYEKAEERVSFLTKEQTHLKEVYAELQATHNSMLKRCEVLEKANKDSKELEERLKNEVARALKAEGELDEARRKASQAEQTLAHEERARKQTSEKCLAAESRSRRAEQALADAQSELAKIQISLEKSESRFASTLFEMKGTQRELELSKNENERFEEENQRLRRANESLEEAVDRLRTTMLENHAEVLDKEKKQHTERLELMDRLHAKQNQYREVLDKVNSMESELEQLRERYSKSEEELAGYRARCSALQENEATLREEMKEIKTRSETQLHDLSDRNVSLLRQLTDRVAGEKDATEQIQRETEKYQTLASAWEERCHEAQKNYKMLVVALSDLGILSCTEASDNSLGYGKPNVDSSGRPMGEDVVHENIEFVLKDLTQGIQQLKHQGYQATSEVEKLMFQLKTLQTELEVYRETGLRHEKHTVGPCEQCKTLQTKIRALELEVCEKQKLLEDAFGPRPCEQSLSDIYATVDAKRGNAMATTSDLVKLQEPNTSLSHYRRRTVCDDKETINALKARDKWVVFSKGKSSQDSCHKKSPRDCQRSNKSENESWRSPLAVRNTILRRSATEHLNLGKDVDHGTGASQAGARGASKLSAQSVRTLCRAHTAEHSDRRDYEVVSTEDSPLSSSDEDCVADTTGLEANRKTYYYHRTRVSQNTRRRGHLEAGVEKLQEKDVLSSVVDKAKSTNDAEDRGILNPKDHQGMRFLQTSYRI